MINNNLTLSITVKPISKWHMLMMRLGLEPAVKVLSIQPITLGNMVRISRLMLSIEVSPFERQNIISESMLAIEKYSETAATVIATAIYNRRRRPPASLVRFILNQFTASDLKSTLLAVIQQMDLSNFTGALIALRGLDLLNKSETTAESAV